MVLRFNFLLFFLTFCHFECDRGITDKGISCLSSLVCTFISLFLQRCLKRYVFSLFSYTYLSMLADVFEQLKQELMGM